MFLAATATAALVALPSASALIATHDVHSSRKLFSRQSLVRLDANQQPFSELDKLRAKRLSLRPRVPKYEAETSFENNDDFDMDVAHGSLTPGLEYLYEAEEERHSDDLFHIILMPSTFGKDRMSIDHVTESCTDVLGIPSEKAHDLSLFAKHQGFSCLGTWTREECLSMGEELFARDLDCRVIPFSEGLAPANVPDITAAAVDVRNQKGLMEDTFLLAYSS